MDEPKPNPLTSHLLGMVQGRQQAELAKLALLTQIAEHLSALRDTLNRVELSLAELLERSKG